MDQIEQLRGIIGDKFVDEYITFKKELTAEQWIIYEKEISKVISKTILALDNINLKFMDCLHIDEVKEKDIKDQYEVKEIMDVFMPLMIAYQLFKK